MSNDVELHNSRELRCQELVELVTAYLQGELVAGDQMCFEQHLARCEGCANYLTEMNKIIKVAGELREESMNPRVKAQLLATFRNWTSERRMQPGEAR
jgi:anti-sigma factor RsiW